MKQRIQRGFTLYELMVTLAVVGVVLVIGVPNLGAYRQNARMTSTANDLHSAFHLARTESTPAMYGFSASGTAMLPSSC